MTRLWLGVVILVAFLLICLWVGAGMDRVHLEISDNLQTASDKALSGDWEGAKALAEQAKTAWQRSRNKTAAVADHAPMDEIEGLLAQLDSFALTGERVHFAATCAQLSCLVAAMAEAHSPTWWNFL